MSSHRPLEAGSMASAASHADQQAQITLRDELPALEQAGYGRHHPPWPPSLVFFCQNLRYVCDQVSEPFLPELTTYMGMSEGKVCN